MLSKGRGKYGGRPIIPHWAWIEFRGEGSTFFIQQMLARRTGVGGSNASAMAKIPEQSDNVGVAILKIGRPRLDSASWTRKRAAKPSEAALRLNSVDGSWKVGVSAPRWLRPRHCVQQSWRQGHVTGYANRY